MKKIATITFHSSYNYGSNLQAYALQEYIKKISNEPIDYKIINLRTNIQKEMYKSIYEKSGIKNSIKKILFLKYKNQLELKQKNFEDFIQNKLQITKEYNSYEELMNEKFDFDYYISGSDQLWNLKAKDFDWSNYLEFVKKGKKISYAASYGPKKQNWNEEQKKRITKDLTEYEHLSVREQGSYNNIYDLTGRKPEINVDPTMLLEKNDWIKLIGKKTIVKGDYILLYDLKGRKEDLELAKQISKMLDLPVVITKYMDIKTHFSSFKKHYECGPIEFLNLIYNSKLVLSSSFHGNVFSVILNKPFFALNGINDFRIKTMLEKFELTTRSISSNDLEEKCKKAFEIDYKKTETMLNKERSKSEEYLKEALDMN